MQEVITGIAEGGKEILGYEGRYKIFEDGRIWSIPRIYETSLGTKVKTGGHFLKPSTHHTGYLVVPLWKGSKTKVQARIHRLVAKAFIPNPQNKPQVNHINGKRDDNRVENLEWATVSENALHSFKIGLQKGRITNNKINIRDAIKIREAKSKGETVVSLSNRFRITPSNIYYILQNKTWKTT